MRILFVALDELMYKHTMFMGTELEFISDHLDKEDEVFVLLDDIIRKSFFNPTASLVKKNQSIIRFLNALKFLNLSKTNILNMKIFKDFEVPNVFNNLNELKSFHLYDVDFGEGVASSIISLLKDHEVNTIENHELIYDSLFHSICIYKNFIQQSKVLNIDKVYIFNGRLSEQRPVVRACQDLQIPFTVFEMGNSIFTYCVAENNWIHDIGYFTEKANLSWDFGGASKVKVAENWFIARRNGDQGRNSFTGRQVKGLLPFGFDLSCKNIGIFNSSMYEYAAISEMKNPIYNDEMEGLINILESFKGRRDVKFYLRVHPHLLGYDNSQVKILKNLYYENLEIIWPESLIDSYELILACDKILTFGSSIGVEANFFKKPSILVGRAFYENLDCCYIPQNHDQVVDMINSKLEPKDNLGALKYAYYNVIRSVPYRKYDPQGEKFLGVNLNCFDTKERLSIKISSISEKITNYFK